MKMKFFWALIITLALVGAVNAATATLNTPADNYNITSSPYTLKSSSLHDCSKDKGILRVDCKLIQR